MFVSFAIRFYLFVMLEAKFIIYGRLAEARQANTSGPKGCGP
jgi:hypothetical protein